MVNVTLVCVAGVSGTFLARRMRALDPALTVTVESADSLASVSGADLVLVAPQLASSLEHIARVANPVRVAVLPPDAYSPAGADEAVRTVHDLLDAAGSAYRRSEPANTKE
ncbi:PTS sugar transporter subunit IIB [Herbiconiux sp. L3-i23]|uniref:PTS sugar transporter subunit IIB n=1 Tax=Herbiconiux sp. L3-i23 TaxID=2905871 RepID=UPI0020489816|nr:hypothetical protein [Herbiconiux sp. L3-i23]BDI23860.1 hypothetical protein L3i23_26360 [Herbiconiux sp. L3-i23]